MTTTAQYHPSYHVQISADSYISSNYFSFMYCWWFRNPAPADMAHIQLFTRFYTCQLVQDFFHQQYHWIPNVFFGFLEMIPVFLRKKHHDWPAGYGISFTIKQFGHHVPSQKLTWLAGKWMKMYFLLKIRIFQCHLSFWGCSSCKFHHPNWHLSNAKLRSRRLGPHRRTVGVWGIWKVLIQGCKFGPESSRQTLKSLKRFEKPYLDPAR